MGARWSQEEAVRTLKGHTQAVGAVAISPHGQWIVSGSYDGTLRVWHLSDGTHVRTLEGHTRYVRSVAISPDGQWIVSGSWDSTLRVWRLPAPETPSPMPDEASVRLIRSV
jgi:WD40 repeat protein